MGVSASLLPWSPARLLPPNPQSSQQPPCVGRRLPESTPGRIVGTQQEGGACQAEALWTPLPLPSIQ